LRFDFAAQQEFATVDGTILPLASDFEAPTRAQWLSLVEKTLKGQTYEDALIKHTGGRVALQPLYTAEDAPPATVRDLSPRDATRPWDLRTTVAHPDPTRANADILKDLENGAASVVVTLDPTGKAGVAAGSAGRLGEVLAGVLLDLAPVALDAGFLGPRAADWLGALAKAAPEAPLALHMDPLSAFAGAGVSPGPVESHLISAATVGARLAPTYPKATLMLATGRAVHEAGGTEAQELGFMAASLLAYAKALTRAGLSADDAFSRIAIGVSVDGEYFTDIAKVRAARAVFARIADASGVTAKATLEARSSGRMLTKKDPWTNLLRLTAAGFGAAVGGTDAVILGAFTDALGLPTAFGRRQVRNTQLVLMEESHLGRVADPAGGTWYLEKLTDDLARAAWAEFQAIEKAGGAIEALADGSIAARVAAARASRETAIADKAEKILGVTVFPNAEDKPVEVENPDAAAFADKDTPDPRLPGPDGKCPALTPIRWAAAFEEA
jgi:methylmalonyl-CoA mutase